MKYAVEMGSGALIYKSSFIKIISAIQNLLWLDTHAYSRIRRRNRDLIVGSKRAE
jgi:hypothetical protein